MKDSLEWRGHPNELGFKTDAIATDAWRQMLRKLGLAIDAVRLSERICSGSKMAATDKIDQKTKPIFRGLYGWNLFVAAPGR